ncbi:uncharacterized protein LOC134793071 [Cydia splendana]|uniref:uncharacterized protein LOC134793071 n=1 Tax=Cydia splendana TaxID=1100963 RepID=UPI00300C98B3
MATSSDIWGPFLERKVPLGKKILKWLSNHVDVERRIGIVVESSGYAEQVSSDQEGAAPSGWRTMYARTQRLRLQAISLAILLAIIDQTQAFTLRYKYVRPHDLTAEESRVTQVGHEVKRDIVENEEFQVAPIGVALSLIMTTESEAETTFQNEIVTSNNLKETNQIEPTNEQVQSKVKVEDKTTFQNEIVTSNNLKETNQIEPTNEQVESKVKVEDSTSAATDNEVKSAQNLIPMMNSELERENSTPLTQVETTTVTTEGITTEASTNKESNESKTTDDIISIVNTTTPDVTVSEPPNTAVTTTESNIIETTHTWKKYTTIERKHVTVNENVVPLRLERIGDSINAHTTETRVSLEKAFNLAPDILSLQELKSHLLDATNSVPTEVNSTEIVSKRAGYLNHTTPELDALISTTVNALQASYEVETDGGVYEMDTHEESDYTLNKTSHSQMVEDALKEELLVEANLEDKNLFTTTPKSNRSYVEQNEITPSPEITRNDQQTDNYLIVRPINSDKKSILYTVSPNYKPLKKIEVQPSKPFVRDPDDNSWRNESLSSLGIVFKGKNSTKAFTEVIKNKTEIVMNNTTEPEKVLMKVDLRDRLEKIAEKRKRKKKIDNNGNTEYGDYEENSSGDTHTSKEKPEINLATLPTPPELVNPGIIFGTKLEESPNKYPSKKPKFTLDYYDGKDDDADYATYPNIDILKSTPRPRVQWPVTQRILDNTHHVRTYLPDRQPTVQYFPPRPKTQNDYKVPPFGHTAQPQTGSSETYTKNTENIPATYITTDKIQHVEYRPVGTNDGFRIRHYKDLLESVAQDMDYDKNGPYQRPITEEGPLVKSDYYGLRKEGIDKYVDYLNQNHERFKADFPVVFNTSIVHGTERGKVLASSSAMFKRLYNGAQTKEAFGFSNKPFDPNCDNVTVELSPAYELHYYVPDQEETEAGHTLPYGYTH